MVTAAPQDQWRLLDVQDLDTTLAQIAHRRRNLPEHAEAERIGQRAKDLADALITAEATARDIAREVTKAENDVDLVRQRATRTRARLDAGQGPPKELQAMQHELESLGQRQSALEDLELEVMERLEQAQAEVSSAQAEVARLAEELAEVVLRRDRELARLDEETAAAQRTRADAAAGLPADLLALYEKIRESSGGLGAARIRARRCEGCRIELTTSDLGRIRTAAQDAVVRCEECRRILVRTPDSGL